MDEITSICNDRQIAGLKATEKPYRLTVTACPGLRIKVRQTAGRG